jgi:protein SCO1/2
MRALFLSIALCTVALSTMPANHTLAGNTAAADRITLGGVRRGPELPNVVLLTQDNKPVRFYDDLIKGRVVLLNFMFTACKTTCPMTRVNLLKVQKGLGDHLGRDIFIYSLTLDAATDTPQALHRYAKSIGAKPGWTFLTGKPADLEMLRRKLGFYDPDPTIDADRTQHGAVVLLGNDAAGRWAMMPALVNADRIVDAFMRIR